jgi:hypothetical protein
MRKLLYAFGIMLTLLVSFSVAAQIFNPPSTRTVTGTEIVNYKNGPVPVDLSATTINAYVPSGSGYTVLPGTGTSSGTFTVPNVPTGFYFLQLGTSYLWTNSSTVNADTNFGYRSDIVAADPNGTFLSFDLANLNPWQSTDFFEIVCPNNNSFEFFPANPGDTTFTGTYNYFGDLSVAAEGDQYYGAQLASQSVGGFPFTALARYIAPPKFTQAQDSTTPIDGTLRTIAQTNTLEANINGADLLASALAANPKATLYASDFGLDVFPGSFAHGQTTATPDLVIYAGAPTITSNGDLGPVFYGNPYPSTWPLFMIYAYEAETNYTAPGASSSAPILTGTFGSTTNLPSASNPITPLVGVVQTPSVNGKNFFGNLKGVGVSPQLRWSAPAVGTATYYLVAVYQLSNVNGSTQVTAVASFSTQQASLRIPAGVLSSGQTYVFGVNAYYIPGLNFAKTPYYMGSTTAAAGIISGVMQP